VTQLTPARFLAGPDPIAAWMRLDRLTRHVVGLRMERGPVAGDR
jgi:hypothetical protein